MQAGDVMVRSETLKNGLSPQYQADDQGFSLESTARYACRQLLILSDGFACPGERAGRHDGAGQTVRHRACGQRTRRSLSEKGCHAGGYYRRRIRRIRRIVTGLLLT